MKCLWQLIHCETKQVYKYTSFSINEFYQRIVCHIDMEMNRNGHCMASRPEVHASMGWVNPRVKLGWVGSAWVEFFNFY